MTAHHICLLGDANSVHVQRWAREMLARGWRLSLVTARPQAIEGVQQIVLPPVRLACCGRGRTRAVPIRRLRRTCAALGKSLRAG